MYIRRLIPRNFAELAKAVPIVTAVAHIVYCVLFSELSIHYRSLANSVYCSSICFQCSSPDQVYLRYLICTLTALELFCKYMGLCKSKNECLKREAQIFMHYYSLQLIICQTLKRNIVRGSGWGIMISD